MVFSSILGLGKRHTKKRHSRHSRKSKKHQGALTKKEIETIREYTTKTRVFAVGDADMGEMLVKITPHDITFRDKIYKYEKLFILNWDDTWISEKQYMMPVNKNKKIPDTARKNEIIGYDNTSGYYVALYILVKINDRLYLSLGWHPFEFEIPDNDEILNVSGIRTTRSGTQNITLFGRRNIYFIDYYNEEIDLNSYISNEDIKKYLPQFITPDGQIDRNISLDYIARDYDISHYASDKGEGKGKGPYLIQKEKHYKKVLGVKVPIWKEKRIYDVIHYLDTLPA